MINLTNLIKALTCRIDDKSRVFKKSEEFFPVKVIYHNEVILKLFSDYLNETNTWLGLQGVCCEYYVTGISAKDAQMIINVEKYDPLQAYHDDKIVLGDLLEVLNINFAFNYNNYDFFFEQDTKDEQNKTKKYLTDIFKNSSAFNVVVSDLYFISTIKRDFIFIKVEGLREFLNKNKKGVWTILIQEAMLKIKKKRMEIEELENDIINMSKEYRKLNDINVSNFLRCIGSDNGNEFLAEFIRNTK